MFALHCRVNTWSVHSRREMSYLGDAQGESPNDSECLVNDLKAEHSAVGTEGMLDTLIVNKPAPG